MLTSSRQLQNRSFHIVERTRTSAKCEKCARAKRAKLLFFIVKYTNLWRSSCSRGCVCLSPLSWLSWQETSQFHVEKSRDSAKKKSAKKNLKSLWYLRYANTTHHIEQNSWDNWKSGTGAGTCGPFVRVIYFNDAPRDFALENAFAPIYLATAGWQSKRERKVDTSPYARWRAKLLQMIPTLSVFRNKHNRFC